MRELFKTMLTAVASGPIAPEVIADLKEVTFRVSPKHLLLSLAICHKFSFYLQPKGSILISKLLFQ
jgi:hypothetical protein